MTTAPLAAVADVGGTNTRVALARGAVVDRDSVRRYRNADHASPDAVLAAYLHDTGAAPEAACVAIAGPVRDGVGRLTNRAWAVSDGAIGTATGARTVAVLNDLQAQGYAAPHLGPRSVSRLMPGEAAGSRATRLMLGLGTGLNAAPVYRLGDRILVPPAEAGHVSIPAQNAQELRLLDWLSARHDRPGMEALLSGRGFVNIHAWICDEDGTGTPRAADELMTALESGDPQAIRAGTLFVRLLGRYAGDLALVTLPFGGLYLCGGVARHFAPHLLALGFVEAFTNKGRFGDFMHQFPVFIVTDDYAALTGCAAHLAETQAGAA